MQTLLAIYLHANGVRRRVIELLAKYGLSVSYSTILRWSSLFPTKLSLLHVSLDAILYPESPERNILKLPEGGHKPLTCARRDYFKGGLFYKTSTFPVPVILQYGVVVFVLEPILRHIRRRKRLGSLSSLSLAGHEPNKNTTKG